MLTVSDGVLIAVIVQIGLTVRQFLANRIREKKENKLKFEKEKSENDYKKDVMTQLNKLNEFRISEYNKYEIFTKEINGYRKAQAENKKRFEDFSRSLEYITEYVDQSSEAKRFKHKLNRYSKKIVDISSNDENKVYLNRLRKGFATVSSAVLKCGFSNIDYDTLLDDMIDEGIDESKAEIYIVDIQDIIENNKNNVRISKFLSYSKKFVKDIIEDY